MICGQTYEKFFFIAVVEMGRLSLMGLYHFTGWYLSREAIWSISSRTSNFNFLTRMACQLEPWAKENPFSLNLLLMRYFKVKATGNKTKTLINIQLYSSLCICVHVCMKVSLPRQTILGSCFTAVTSWGVRISWGL